MFAGQTLTHFYFK